MPGVSAKQPLLNLDGVRPGLVVALLHHSMREPARSLELRAVCSMRNLARTSSSTPLLSLAKLGVAPYSGLVQNVLGKKLYHAQ